MTEFGISILHQFIACILAKFNTFSRFWKPIWQFKTLNTVWEPCSSHHHKHLLHQWFSSWGHNPQRVHEPFLEGLQVVFYIHSCITFSLFKLYMGVIRLLQWFAAGFFFGHKLKYFWNDLKKSSNFGQNFWKYRRMNTVMTTFDTTVRQMTEMFQSSKCHSKKRPKGLSEKKGLRYKKAENHCPAYWLSLRA